MSITLEAVYDGQALWPVEPLNLQPNIRLRIIVETGGPVIPARRSFLQTARSLTLEGPSDWSERIEDYLYGDDEDAEK